MNTRQPCPTPFNLAAYVLGRVGPLAEKPALELVGDETTDVLSYGELSAAVLGTATGLLQAGLAPGDRLLMRLGNTVEFPITYLAAIAAGIIPVPTSAQLTGAEISVIAASIDPKGLVFDEGIALPDGEIPVTIRPDELRGFQDLPAAGFHMGDPNRPAYIVFTSGTAGRARGVVHAHRAIWARRMMWDGWYGLRENDRLLHAGAFNWTYTLGTGLMDPWAIGATAIIPKEGCTSADMPEILRRTGASIFAATPGVYRQMLRVKFPALPRLRHGLSAGEKLPRATAQHWQEATGREIYEAFGMSECSTFISSCPTRPAPPDTLGHAQPGRRVAIVDKNGTVQPGTPGTIAVSRDDPGLMLGYLDAPDETAARFQGEWFLTGDTGKMDESGAITYLGRADDMMNAGGFRVSPLEVEAAMRAHPGVTDCAAVEVQVKADTSVIAAFYTGPEPIDEAALATHAQDRLARYKQPRLFRHLDELPIGANGKIQRRLLRDRPF